MAHWLLKTEPDEYPFEQLVSDRRARWDGIANPVSLKNLRAAAPGDRCVIYHTGSERRAVGLAEVVRAAYDDPSHDGHVPVIDIEAREPLPQPVELATIKADPAFDGSPLVKQARLSFVPLTEAQWARLMALARKKARR